MSTVSLAPMPAERMSEWIERTKSDYRDERIRSGESVRQATDDAEQSFGAYFPGGSPAPRHRVFDIVGKAGGRSVVDGEAGGLSVVDGKAGGRSVVADARVGTLWIGPQSLTATDEWWVWNIAIDEQHRGRGLGRAAMLAAEVEVAESGGRVLGLNVFGFNSVARGLYESLGYSETSIRMHKVLGGDAR